MPSTPQSQQIEDMMMKIVTQLSPVSNKFTDHSYQIMYGTLLMSWRVSKERQ